MPFRLTSKMWSHSSSSISKKGVGLFVPGAFSKISQPPDHASISSATFSSDSREMTSAWNADVIRSEEHTSELQSRGHLVCRLLLEKKKSDNRGTRDRSESHEDAAT